MRKRSKLSLLSSVERLKGFGPKTAAKAHKLGIKTVKDLLTYFPFRFDDYSKHDLDGLPDKEKVSLEGLIASVPRWGKKGVVFFKLAYAHSNKFVWVSFFHQPWIPRITHKFDKVLIYGTYRNNGLNPKIIGERLTKLNRKNNSNVKKFQPIYNSVQGIKQYEIRKMVTACYRQCHQLIHNVVSPKIRAKYRLEDEQKVIHDMQFPRSKGDNALARRTEKFDELYLYELWVQEAKVKNAKKPGISINNYSKKDLRLFDNNLPFKLTEGQLQSIYYIIMDISSKYQMNRLLQGDVGSGKTVVAAFAILAAITAGYQAAVMIPTSVLGEQHYKTFRHMFRRYNINIILVTGDMTPSQKQYARYMIDTGKANLIIGTDALIQPKVKFANLGLAVIDEQHKFGVDQRKALVNKGHGVNFLAMTATPIPRTLAITEYGDMSLSVIDTLPKGRKPIITKCIPYQHFDSEVSFIQDIMSKGQQVYCVVPLIQQTEKSQITDNKADVITTYKRLQKIFGDYSVGLLHGQMDDKEKDKILHAFKIGKIQMLISTTVVEVGVDAPKATLMIIFNADNFGLATLHQLRGRVGRNSIQSYCLLIANPRSKVAKQRMHVMEATNDGFKISQRDLEIRGQGNVLNTQQSGQPQFKVADCVNDKIMLKCAYREARLQVEKSMNNKHM